MPKFAFTVDSREVAHCYMNGHQTDGRWEVTDLFVDPLHRDRGVGTFLLTQAVAYADKLGWPLLLYAAPDAGRDEDLLRFYGKFGFKKVGHKFACYQMHREVPVPLAKTG